MNNAHVIFRKYSLEFLFVNTFYSYNADSFYPPETTLPNPFFNEII